MSDIRANALCARNIGERLLAVREPRPAHDAHRSEPGFAILRRLEDEVAERLVLRDHRWLAANSWRKADRFDTDRRRQTVGPQGKHQRDRTSPCADRERVEIERALG